MVDGILSAIFQDLKWLVSLHQVCLNIEIILLIPRFLLTHVKQSTRIKKSSVPIKIFAW